MYRDEICERQDRRVVRSKRAIVQAFERLLLERPLEEITVSAIAREAGVDRKTFYQHYGSIDGLIDAIAAEAVGYVLDAVEEARSAADGGDDERFSMFFSRVNEVVCRDIAVSRRYFESVPTDKLLEHMREPFARGIIERRLLARDVPDAYVECCTSYVLGGLIAAYRSWLLSNRSMPIEEMVSMVGILVEHGAAGFEGSL